MKMGDVPFGVTSWEAVPETKHPGTEGYALWKTVQAGTVRVRHVTYSPGYAADHWCSRGHIVLVLEGTLITELQGGETRVLTPGMSYQVSDGESSHRSRTETGARLFIVD